MNPFVLFAVAARRLRQQSVLLLVSVLVSLGLSLQVHAADGDLDQSFGAAGRVTTDFGGREANAWGMAVQSDGKIIAVGRASSGASAGIALARYNQDGSLDTTFGSGGKVLVPGSGWLHAVAIQRDGKIIAGGVQTLIRLSNDGSLDASFGVEGKASLDFEIYALAFQPDGKIVAAGAVFGDPAGRSVLFAVGRYNIDGSRDLSFGSGGKVMSDFPGHYSLPSSLVIQGDGKILIGGAYRADPYFTQFALARYNVDGSPDASFGSGGEVTTQFGDGGGLFALAVRQDGKIVAAGKTAHVVNGTIQTGTTMLALVRYNPDGNLDGTFGVNGKVSSPFFPGRDATVRAIAIRPDGKIIVAGDVKFTVPHIASPRIFGLSRYDPNGNLDGSFGASGTVTTAFGSDQENDIPAAISVESDNQVVVLGTVHGGDFFGLARYNEEVRFSLSLDSAMIGATTGIKVRVPVNIDRSEGFAGNVTVTPSDMSALGIRVIPGPVSTDRATAIFKLKIKTSAPVGQQQIVFTGRDDTGAESTVTLTLDIH